MKAPARSAWFGLLALTLCAALGRAAVGAPPSGASPQAGSLPSVPLTNVSGIMRLPRDVAAQELPVDLQGVVTCTYSGNEAFFIHDGQAGVYVDNTQARRHFSFGELVRVEGRTLHGSFCPMVRAEEVQSLGFGTLPAPRPVSFATLASGSADSQWLELRGIIQAVSYWPSSQGVTLDFSMAGGMLQVLVEYPHPPNLTALVDAEVIIHGVASGSFNKKGQMVAPVFRVANMRNTKALTHYAVQELRHGSAPLETLAAGLERTAQYWNRTGALEVRLCLPESTPPLPRESEAALLAVAREAMTNAVKHGQATAIELELRVVQSALQLLVKDNGSGFDLSVPAQNGHFGLQGMRERLRAVGGTLEIHSRPGQGTKLCAGVPTGPGAQFPNVPASGAEAPITQNA